MQVSGKSGRKPCKMMGKEINQKGINSRTKLEDLLDKQHGLYQLANRLNWDYLIEAYGPYYVENNGRPGIPIRVVVGLHYLKYLEQESDESVVEKFCKNPYWQYFCGLEYFQHTLPCHPTTLIKWRNRVGINGVEKLLEHVINTAKREVFFSGKTRGLTQGLKKLLRARSAIEPIIGHAKYDHGLGRNYLLGTVGDKINEVLAGCAFNLRKMMRLLKIDPTTYKAEFAV